MKYYFCLIKVVISMLSERYIRNNIYLSAEEQIRITKSHILLAGAGLGSYIAECALRMGFENITIIDGDQVELSNLNRQNYLMNDIGSSKTESLLKRLLAINPEANIKVKNLFLNENNLQEDIKGVDIAVNALDFSSSIPFIFDDYCLTEGIKILHPYNLGWSGFVFLLDKENSLRNLQNGEKFEINAVNHIIRHLNDKEISTGWIKKAMRDYLKQQEAESPPQLSVGSFIIAGMCTKIMVEIVLNKKTKLFPKFYFATF